MLSKLFSVERNFLTVVDFVLCILIFEQNYLFMFFANCFICTNDFTYQFVI